MTKISSPILFSDVFAIKVDELFDAGLLDPFLLVDTPLFIDPTLLSRSSWHVIRTEGVKSFHAQFEKVVGLLEISEKVGDVAWRNALKFLDFSEPGYTGLGYSSSRRSGTSRPEEVRVSVLKTARDIIRLGSKNPEMISLMGFFEENVGADTISDFTTHAILPQLCHITTEFCKKHRIPTKASEFSGKSYELPYYQTNEREIGPILLVPMDILRSLPVAEDWSQIQEAIDQNRTIRDRVNQILSGIAKPTIIERKSATKKAATQTADLFESFLRSVSEASKPYDPARDTFNFYKFREILRSDNFVAKLEYEFDIENRPDDLLKLVHACIDSFRHHVEHGNLWEELWDRENPKMERAAQLIFYAIADVFCRINDVDISPEANMGGGPVDFKFSRGFKNRVLVEMKRSKGSVVHGYEKQLERYRNASRTFQAIYVIIDYGDLGSKIDKIQKIQNETRLSGKMASDIIVIDATKKKSASKA
jgi:hypothetical protein